MVVNFYDLVFPYLVRRTLSPLRTGPKAPPASPSPVLAAHLVPTAPAKRERHVEEVT